MATKIGYSYIRFSTREQAKGDSLRRQLEATDEWCARNKVMLDTSLTLRDIGSAFTGRHRDNPDKFALAAFVEAVRLGKVRPDSFLVIENLDRLTREALRPAITFFLSLLDMKVNIVTTHPEKVYRHDSNDMIDTVLAVIDLSRGHAESARKSELVGKAWKQKKDMAREQKKPITAMCPHWLKVVDGKYVLIPDRVKIVKRIFREAREVGIGQLCCILNREGIKPFGGSRRKKDLGKPHLWQKSSVARILRNRAVLGEYQPGEGRDRTPVGEVILGYYPAIITEAEFYRAHDAVKLRTGVGVVEKSVGTNLFSGLVVAEDGCSWVYHNKGKAQESMLARSDGLVGADYVNVNYRVFERIILDSFREVTPAELMPNDQRAEVERLEELEGEILAIEARKAEYQVKLNDPRFKGLDAALIAVANLNDQKTQLQEQVEEARRAISAPVVDGLGDAQGLIDLLRLKPTPELRMKVRAKLATVISAIKLSIVSRRGVRYGWAQIQFHRTGYVRNIAFGHRMKLKSRKFYRPEVIFLMVVNEPRKDDAFFDDELIAKVEDMMQFEAAKATGDKAKIMAEADRLAEKYGVRQELLKQGLKPKSPEEKKKVKTLLASKR